MVKRWAQPHDTIEGFNLPDARQIKQAVSIPVIVTGGFQTASVIRRALEARDCDAVSMARPLVANNDLPKLFAQGLDRVETKPRRSVTSACLSSSSPCAVRTRPR
jgi:2,4-dienoyl-CoA reductase-like NADH-dependent reductase (Old Yellow Enzyme family)